MKRRVEHVELQLENLRTQCSVRRKYVENSVEAPLISASETTSPRKRIILLVSRTVTTIIKANKFFIYFKALGIVWLGTNSCVKFQVVDEELEKTSGGEGEDLVALRDKLKKIGDKVDVPQEESKELLEAAKQMYENLQGLLSCDFSHQDLNGLNLSLSAVLDSKSKFRKILSALEATQSSSPETFEYVRSSVVILKSILVRLHVFF